FSTLSTLEVEELFFSSAASADGRRFSTISWWRPFFSAPSVFSTAVVEMVERVEELEAVELEGLEVGAVMERLLEGVEEVEGVEVSNGEETFSISFVGSSTFSFSFSTSSLPWRLHPPSCWRRRSPFSRWSSARFWLMIDSAIKTPKTTDSARTHWAILFSKSSSNPTVYALLEKRTKITPYMKPAYADPLGFSPLF